MGLAPKQLGHLVVKVQDLERAEDFYTRILGLTVTAKFDGHAVFMSANTELSHELLVTMSPTPGRRANGSFTWPGRWSPSKTSRRCIGD